jgi:hypothetical protein
LANNDDQKRSNIVYVEPYDDEDYDRQSSPERLDSAMQRTAEYVSGLNPNDDLYPADNHPHHHHQHDSHGLPPLTIRRHVPGSNDPSLQRMPTNLQPLENISSSSNLHVTIKRNSVSAEKPVIQPVIQPFIQPAIQPTIQPFIQPAIQPAIQPIIQPILYPVPIYINPPPPPPPPPQYLVHQPMEPIPPRRETPKPRSPVKTSPVPPPVINQPLEPITPRKETPKPRSPVKHSPVPPISSNRYEPEPEPEPLQPPPSRNKNIAPANRRPVRLDEIRPNPPTLVPRQVRPSRMVVEEFDEYDEYYRVPSVYSAPKKVVSYRTTAPGKTTREIENDHMDRSGKPGYVESPRLKKITYRTS